jgi:hypothetical protein
MRTLALTAVLGCLACGGGGTSGGTSPGQSQAATTSSTRTSSTGSSGASTGSSSSGGGGGSTLGTGSSGSLCDQAATKLTSCGLSTGGIASDCDAQNMCYASCMLAATCAELQGPTTAQNSYTTCLSGCP